MSKEDIKKCKETVKESAIKFKEVSKRLNEVLDQIQRKHLIEKINQKFKTL